MMVRLIALHQLCTVGEESRLFCIFRGCWCGFALCLHIVDGGEEGEERCERAMHLVSGISSK